MKQIKKFIDGKHLKVKFNPYKFTTHSLRNAYKTKLDCIQLVLANPGSEVMKKLYLSNSIETFKMEHIHPTVADSVKACTCSMNLLSGINDQINQA